MRIEEMETRYLSFLMIFSGGMELINAKQPAAPARRCGGPVLPPTPGQETPQGAREEGDPPPRGFLARERRSSLPGGRGINPVASPNRLVPPGKRPTRFETVPC